MAAHLLLVLLSLLSNPIEDSFGRRQGDKVALQDETKQDPSVFKILKLLGELGRQPVLPVYAKEDESARHTTNGLYIDALEHELGVQESRQKDSVSIPRTKRWVPETVGKTSDGVGHKLAVVLRVAARRPPKAEQLYAADGSTVAMVEQDVFGLRQAFNTSFGPAAHIEQLAKGVAGMADLWVLCDREAESGADESIWHDEGLTCAHYQQAVHRLRAAGAIHTHIFSYNDGDIKACYPNTSWASYDATLGGEPSPLSYSVHEPSLALWWSTVAQGAGISTVGGTKAGR
jgi:hypothetical protein